MYVDQVTTGTGSVPEDEVLERFGYRQQFVRSLRHFESFAVAFSFISITTGIFTTYAFALATGGTRSIWTWLIVVAGQSLVALVYGALSVRVPLSGYSYQWASRLANTHIGWWFGWMSFAFLTIVTVSVDYGLVQVAFQPLIGQAYTPTSAALETLVVLALQAALIITSTRITTRVNNAAVATEIIGIAGLTILLLIVAAVRSMGHWSNLTSTGAVPALGYYKWLGPFMLATLLGPFMLATLLGAYTIVGFESASNLAEETHEPHRVIPKAMIRAVLVSGVVGFAFLVVLAYATNKAAYASAAPVATIVRDVLGGVVQKIFLVFVCVSIFACGMIIMVTNGRLIFAMARDRRLPGHQFLNRVPRATGGPSWATVLAAVLGAVITLALRTHTSALTTLFTASTIMPALLYAGTVLLYVFSSRRAGTQVTSGRRRRPFGKMEIPVVAGALIWLAYELIVLIGPSEFRDAQYYVLGALGLGLVFYLVQLVTEPRAMRQEPQGSGHE
jgi:amino acid transporter